MISPERSTGPMYGERSGVGVEADVQTLLSPPEIELDDSERQVVAQFAQGLFDGYIDDGLKVHDRVREAAGKAPRSLEAINRMSTVSAHNTFYMDYFNTPEGLREIASVGLVSDTEDADDIGYDAMLSANSRDAYIETLESYLKQDPENDSLQPEPKVFTHIRDPDKILDKAEMIQAYRRYYRQVRRAVKDGDDNEYIQQIKHVLLDVHMRKANGMMATAYPTLLNLASQLHKTPDSPEKDSQYERLRHIAPAAEYSVRANDPGQYKEAFVSGLDLVRNGAAWSEDGKTLQPISREVVVLAAELDAGMGDVVPPEASLPTELIAELTDIRWDAGQLKIFLEAVLSDWELLSTEHIDWQGVRKRSGAAKDNGWQVVVTPKRQSMAVDGIKKAIFVPQLFDRGLIQKGETGALPLAAHELEHVLQTEYDQVLANFMPLARLKGRNNSAMREMGGIMTERVLRGMLGQDRSVGVTYLRGLQTKLAGGNRVQAARSFLEATDSESPMSRRIHVAGKNILRLYRQGGHDSQALNYTEQELILRGLQSLPAEQVMAIATAGGSFSLRDSAELHRVGLLHLPEGVPQKPAEDVMRIYLERFHLQLKQKLPQDNHL